MAPNSEMKCKFCSFRTRDRRIMAEHMKNNHRSHVPASAFNSSGYGHSDTSFLDTLIIMDLMDSFGSTSSFTSGSSSSGFFDAVGDVTSAVADVFTSVFD